MVNTGEIGPGILTLLHVKDLTGMNFMIFSGQSLLDNLLHLLEFLLGRISKNEKT